MPDHSSNRGRAHIIGIAGPSCSGKSELAKHLSQRLPRSSIVSLDNYYRGFEGIPLEDRKCVNFDHPDALDWELLREHLQAILVGRAFEAPVYSSGNYARTTETTRIDPGEFVIVEGLFVLYFLDFRAMLDTQVYVRTDPKVCYERRITRDVTELGRSPESVRLHYERHVRPSAEQFVYPTIVHAELVVSGEESFAHSTGAVIAALRRTRSRNPANSA